MPRILAHFAVFRRYTCSNSNTMEILQLEKINKVIEKYGAEPNEINSMASSIKELILYAASAKAPKHFSASDKEFVREDMESAKAAADFLLDLAVAINDKG
jgi:hypothetical protein